MRAYEREIPGIFGPRGGLSRVYAMTDVASTGGMTIGPALSGVLRERFGYTSMNWVFGMSDTMDVLLRRFHANVSVLFLQFCRGRLHHSRNFRCMFFAIEMRYVGEMPLFCI